MKMEIPVSAINSTVALIVALIALVYTVKTYLLKSGLKVRGTYAMSSDITCEEHYVSSVIIENIKDRAIVIFKIFLRVGNCYYIEIDEFEDKPLIIKPFEAFFKEYGPIVYYDVGTKRILLDSLLKNDKIKKQLVLKTTDGKYKVKTFTKYWDPISYLLYKNHFTAVVQPIRMQFNERAYGGNVRFLVEIISGNKENEVVAICHGDHERLKFKHFKLTKESIESKGALEAYLSKQMENGCLSCDSFKVIDLEKFQKENYKLEQKKVITAEPIGRFEYHILGRIYTIVDDYKLRMKNKKIRKANASDGK